MAHIDSAGQLIQMPMSEFKQLTSYLRVIDPTVRWDHRQEEEGYRLATNQPCDEISHKYGDLEFTLGDTEIVIHPKGYLSPMFGDEKFCVLGIEGISDSLNEYRLGSIFLRNFYVGLDYEKNQLVLGLNKGNLDATMTYPDTDDDGRHKTLNMVGLFVGIYFILVLLLALICFIRSKRLKEREVVFDGPSSVTDPTQTEYGMKENKPKYKNGVEVMPSEAQKIKKEQKEKLIKKKGSKKAKKQTSSSKK